MSIRKRLSKWLYDQQPEVIVKTKYVDPIGNHIKKLNEDSNLYHLKKLEKTLYHGVNCRVSKRAQLEEEYKILKEIKRIEKILK